MTRIRFQIAPDVEFKMDTEVYQEFERRLKKAFPEGIRIDRFEFGLNLENAD